MSDRSFKLPEAVAGVLAALVLIVPMVLAFALVPERNVVGALGAEGLETQFRDHGYDLDRIADGRATVPRLFASQFPTDLPELDPAARRKLLFAKIMLPLILNENERINANRARAGRLIGRAHRSRAEVRWLRRLAADYGVEYGVWGRLSRRMDVVPTSLALAQGAIESGWGTSRFAQQGNAVFGQWTTDRSGMTPERRAAGATHRVATFRNLGRSVARYMHNLNTHSAYTRFREVRAQARSSGRTLSGAEYAGALEEYSETGGEYIGLLRQIIGDERLARFDWARLEPR